MVGARFRAQGYAPATGLDCVGLVWAAYAAAGRELVRPTGYPLRGWSRARIEAALAAAGFAAAAAERPRSGDLALIAYPARQYHLGLLGPETLVHAHAGLRRVVETPVDAQLLAAAHWRLS
ncbi:hypothetical protein ATE71_21210 [Sphingopyxis sp. H115]|nr:hypothetical protein ATE71_21210 [Sphingopyxis sp. H115]